MRTRVFAAIVMAMGSIASAAARSAGAQERSSAPGSPWEVTVTPTLNPLPVGLCGAVRLAIADGAGKDTPRNPAGFRVSLADFDMSVTAPDGKSVVGQSIDERHWSVCFASCP